MKKVIALVLVFSMTVFFAISVSAVDTGKYTPTIDGDKDEAYDKSFSFGVFEQDGVTANEGFYSTYGDTAATLDAKAYFLWDDKFLYIYVDVTDDDPTDAGADYVNDNANPWESEAVELWTLIDDLDDVTLYNKTSIELFSNKFFGEGTNFEDMMAGGSKAIAKKTDKGYAAEFALAIPGGLTAGKQIKASLQINDRSPDGTNAIGKQVNNSDPAVLIALTMGAEIVVAPPATEAPPATDAPAAPEAPAAAAEVAPVPAAAAAPAPQTGDSGIIFAGLALLASASVLILRTKKPRYSKNIIYK